MNASRSAPCIGFRSERSATSPAFGRGNWSPVVLQYDPKRRAELPVPMGVRVGDRVPLNGRDYRVSEVRE